MVDPVMRPLSPILFAPGRDERLASVGVVLAVREDGVLTWIPVYDPKTGGLRPWGTVGVVPLDRLISMPEMERGMQ